MAGCKSKVKKIKKEKGFTIIEVALVLAIAGLIFLVVFLAVPALQRNQRDDARKKDVGNLVQAINSWSANTSGSAALTSGAAYNGTTVTGSLVGYLDAVSGNTDTITIQTAVGDTGTTTVNTTTIARLGIILIYPNARCAAATSTNSITLNNGAGRRSSAIVTRLEAGGSNMFYCQSA